MVLVLYDELSVSCELRTEMSAIYLWINLGSNEAVTWLIQAPNELRYLPNHDRNSDKYLGAAIEDKEILSCLFADTPGKSEPPRKPPSVTGNGTLWASLRSSRDFHSSVCSRSIGNGLVS